MESVPILWFRIKRLFNVFGLIVNKILKNRLQNKAYPSEQEFPWFPARNLGHSCGKYLHTLISNSDIVEYVLISVVMVL